MTELSVKNGIDLVQISHLKARLQRHPQDLLLRLFTERERQELGLEPANPGRSSTPDKRQAGFSFPSFPLDERQLAHIAARYAAKEAFVKALGVGLWGARGLSLHTVEVLRQSSGEPLYHWETAALEPYLQSPTGQRQILSAALSLSHEGDYAVASCVLLLAETKSQ